MVVPREPPKKEENNEILNHGVRELNENTAFSEISATYSPVDTANILIKSSVPVYYLSVFACFFFPFMAIFLPLLIVCL